MGSSSSRTRKITLDNENPMSVIKVSEDVVQRIKGKEEVRGPAVVQQGPATFYEPSLTSIQLRQANLDALKKNDEYWDKRIENLQKGHQQMQLIMEEEYAKAVKDITIRKANKEYESSKVCGDSRQKVIACYKKNKGEPMKCAKEVQQFAECVDQKRASLIANRG